MNNQKKILPVVAFVLFLTGIVLPFVSRSFASSSAPVALAVVASILSLILGLNTHSFLLGRIAWVGALVVCVLGTINAIRFFSGSGESELRTRMEQEWRR